VPGGYRLPLYQILTNAGINVAFVGNANNNSAPGLPYPNHDGYGGWDLNMITAQIPNWAANIPSPKYVLLMAGINDFTENYDVQHATNRLENLIVEIATNCPNATVVVADLDPWVNDQPTNTVMQTWYDPFIPGIVARQSALGRKVLCADMRGQIPPTDLEADNVHPTQQGYNIIATNWYRAAFTSSPTPPGNLHIVSVR
jgi:lysophospholipase L1-like esterase